MKGELPMIFFICLRNCAISLFFVNQLWVNFLFSTDTSEKKLKFFTLDWHSSVSKDLIDIFHDLGHEVTYWSIGPYTQRIFKHDNVKNDPNSSHLIFDLWNPAENLCKLDEKVCYEFYETYKEFLEQFDAFIVSPHSSLAFIFEKLNKPVIIVNAARYEFPFAVDSLKFKNLNQLLIKKHASGDFHFVANNKGDRYYLQHYTGIRSELIPSLCSYTNAKHEPKSQTFLVHKPVSNDIIWSLDKLFQNDKITYLESFIDVKSTYEYKGIIHFPYQISVMSLFEQYYANVPLFFPSKKFLLKLKEQFPFILSAVSYSPCSEVMNNPNNLSDRNILKKWIRSADFYDEKNMPYIQYFSSFEELHWLLHVVNTEEISKNMKKHNIQRKVMIYEKWKKLLEKIAAHPSVSY